MKKLIISTNNLSFQYNGNMVLNNIYMELFDHSIYCLLGESGSGKTTLAKIIATLLPEFSGELYFQKYKYDLTVKKKIKYLRKNIRLIFQSPETTLNPRMNMFKILSEPLTLYNKGLSKDNIKSKIITVLKKVQLTEISNDIYSKNISQLSGGQKRRLAIARAIVNEPKLLIADEPTEGLDISLQGGIIELFRNLNISMLLITHNYSVAAALADKIGIMYKGRIVEELETNIRNAKHPFTISMRKSLEKFNGQNSTKISNTI